MMDGTWQGKEENSAKIRLQSVSFAEWEPRASTSAAWRLQQSEIWCKTSKSWRKRDPGSTGLDQH